MIVNTVWNFSKRNSIVWRVLKSTTNVIGIMSQTDVV
jgi:CBS-domain-containing membrane protein